MATPSNSAAPNFNLPKDSHGLLLIDKPEGITSFNVLEHLQRAMTAKTGLRKRDLPTIGHCGTLDPFATGLLLIAFGEGVKLARYLIESKQTYEAVMRFGASTVSGDFTNPVNETTEVIPLSLDEIRLAAHSFTTETYVQMPPMHSAKKVEGKRLYEYAREGKDIARDAKHCTVDSLEILDYMPPRATLLATVSAGTFIRTLSQDLAKRLGSLASLEKLRRTASGRFGIADALPFARIESFVETWLAGGLAGESAWVPFNRLLDGLPRFPLTEIEVGYVIHGRKSWLQEITGKLPAGPRIAAYQGDKLIAVFARNAAGEASFERVFAWHF